MIDSYYQSNFEELNLFDEFEQNYQSKEALHCFIKNSFLNQIINEALRTKNIDQLYSLRYFLVDLINNLASKHRKIAQSNREYLIVYRQMNLSIDEFNQLQQNNGKLISMKGFFMANTVRSVPTPSINRTDSISVLFEIECNIKQLDDQVIFADVNPRGRKQTSVLLKYRKYEEVHEVQKSAFSPLLFLLIHFLYFKLHLMLDINIPQDAARSGLSFYI
jgi:hypothetical protein